jgi:hypothetical protein
METASSSGTSVNFYQTTRRNNPEDSHLQREFSIKPVSFIAMCPWKCVTVYRRLWAFTVTHATWLITKKYLRAIEGGIFYNLIMCIYRMEHWKLFLVAPLRDCLPSRPLVPTQTMTAFSLLPHNSERTLESPSHLTESFCDLTQSL